MTKRTVKVPETAHAGKDDSGSYLQDGPLSLPEAQGHGMEPVFENQMVRLIAQASSGSRHKCCYVSQLVILSY
jgi:hypothetical protein